MADTNQRLAKLEEARSIIEDNLIVMAHLEKRQAEMLKEHSMFLAELTAQNKMQAAKNKEVDERIEKLVSAIGALIRKQ